MRKQFKKYFLAVYLFLFSLTVLAQESTADSLKNILNTTTNDTLRISTLYLLVEYYAEAQPDTAIIYSKKMRDYARKLDLPVEEIESLIFEGYSVMNLGNYPRSLQLFQDAIKIAEDPASARNVMPDQYYRKDQFLQPPVTPEMRRLSSLGRTHQFLGILYSNTNNQQKELSHYHVAIDIQEKTGDVAGLVATYLTLGRVYLTMKKTDSALYAEEKAYNLVQKTGYRKYLGSILINLGRIQTAMGNDEKAKQYFRDAIDASAEQHYLRGIVAANLYLGETFSRQEKMDSSIYHIRGALKTAEVLNSASLLQRCYNALATYYATTLLKDSTIKYQQLVIRLNDNLFNAKQFQQFENIDADAEQRRLEIAGAERAYKQRLQNYLLLGGLIVFLLLALVLWRNNSRRQQINKVLEKQKNELQITLTELKATQAQLIQSEKMASLGELTAGIAHEIQNPLNFVNNFAELNKELISDMKTEIAGYNYREVDVIAQNIKINEDKILEHGKRAEAIVKNMLQHSRANTGKKEVTDINELINEFIRLSFHGTRAKDQHFEAKIETNLDPGLPRLTVVPQDIGRVLLNLINNAFYAVGDKKKNANEGYEPRVLVSTKTSGEKVMISIADNGAGITTKNMEKIFLPFFTTKPAGQGTGLGLSLSYDIIKAHGGEIIPETVEGKGTTFTIVLPVA